MMNKCHEEVSRGGQLQPCDKVAVAFRIDPEERTPYPVCAWHTRGEIVSLAALVAELRAHRAAAEKVRALHVRVQYGHDGISYACERCSSWSVEGLDDETVPWPCPTITALDGAAEKARLITDAIQEDTAWPLRPDQPDRSLACWLEIHPDSQSHRTSSCAVPDRRSNAVSETEPIVGIEVTREGRCPAAVNLRGEDFQCDSGVDHQGWAHSSRSGQMVWKGSVLDGAQQLPPADTEAAS